MEKVLQLLNRMEADGVIEEFANGGAIAITLSPSIRMLSKCLCCQLLMESVE